MQLDSFTDSRSFEVALKVFDVIRDAIEILIPLPNGGLGVLDRTPEARVTEITIHCNFLLPLVVEWESTRYGPLKA
ncbi:MAG: hypothetical protein ACLQU2_16065 [Candidatus Binataceae bacterium]